MMRSPLFHVRTLIRAAVVLMLTLLIGVAGSSVFPAASSAISLTPEQAYRLENGQMTAHEYLSLDSAQRYANPYTVTPSAAPYYGYASQAADCNQLAAQCAQQQQDESAMPYWQYSYQLASNACATYQQYCSGSQIAPMASPQTSCQVSSCANGNACPTGTTCVGYPSYACVVNSCLQPTQAPQTPYGYPSYPVSQPTYRYRPTSSWWQPIIIPPAPALPTITPAPALPTITPAPALPTITPAPPISTQPAGTYDPSACVCSQIYQPVCATNGITYPNSCYARCAGQTVLGQGTCQATAQDLPYSLRTQ